jgi:hypothetical protein
MRCISATMVRIYSARSGDIEQLLDGPHIGIIVRHCADIVESVGVRNDLHVRQTFREFFHSPMEVSQIRCRFDDPFSIQFKDNPHHPVRARMLWPHVQQEFFPPVGRRCIRLRQEQLLLSLGDLAFNLLDRRFIKAWDKVELTAPASAFGWEILP